MSPAGGGAGGGVKFFIAKNIKIFLLSTWFGKVYCAKRRVVRYVPKISIVIFPAWISVKML